MAAWSWRLLLLGAMIYFLWQVIGRISFVVMPVVVALLLASLLYPLTRRLRTAGLRLESVAPCPAPSVMCVLEAVPVADGTRS